MKSFHRVEQTITIDEILSSFKKILFNKGCIDLIILLPFSVSDCTENSIIAIFLPLY